MAKDVTNINIFHDDTRVLLREKREIILVHEIDSCIASDFMYDMRLCAHISTKPVTIILASPGGDMLDGFSIIRSIRDAQAQGVKVTGRVFGQAFSMAFFILQACDERLIGSESFLMVHGVYTFQGADIKNREAEDHLLKQAKDYMSRLILSRNTSKIDKWHNALTWEHILREQTPNYFSAQAALEAGLVDGVEL